MKRPLVVMALLSAAIFATLGCAANSSRRAPDHSDRYDRRFLTATLNQLNGDLRLARACEGKRIRPELAEFCERLFENRSQEQRQLSAWLKNWYQREVQPEPFRLWIETQDGESFERYFLKGVLEANKDLAERAEDCTRRAKHSELADHCKQGAPARVDEAKKLEQWNCQWFKNC